MIVGVEAGGEVVGFWLKGFRFTGKCFMVEFITVALCMKKFPHQHFRLCVFAFYLLHVKTPLLLCVYVCHIALQK